jgi:serine/threonine-protein kinase RsbW
VRSLSRPRTPIWHEVSFASTLHLQPILDLLLSSVPVSIRPELHLGLQEAIVNAAKHGNSLDPCKVVSVRYSTTRNVYSWIICDQGQGFEVHGLDPTPGHGTSDGTSDGATDDWLPCDEQCCGRGLFILHQVFDEVTWNDRGTELHLCKQVERQSPLAKLARVALF